jgi:hypothetical protein
LPAAIGTQPKSAGKEAGLSVNPVGQQSGWTFDGVAFLGRSEVCWINCNDLPRVLSEAFNFHFDGCRNAPKRNKGQTFDLLLDSLDCVGSGFQHFVHTWK